MPITESTTYCDPFCVKEAGAIIYCEDPAQAGVFVGWEIPHVVSVTPAIDRNEADDRRTSSTKGAFVKFCNEDNATYTFSVLALGCESEPYNCWLRDGLLYYVRLFKQKMDDGNGNCVPVAPYCEFQAKYLETKPTWDNEEVGAEEVTHEFESRLRPVYYGYTCPAESFEGMGWIDAQETTSVLDPPDP